MAKRKTAPRTKRQVQLVGMKGEEYVFLFHTILPTGRKKREGTLRVKGNKLAFRSKTHAKANRFYSVDVEVFRDWVTNPTKKKRADGRG